jgi:hypothetical protein
MAASFLVGKQTEFAEESTVQCTAARRAGVDGDSAQDVILTPAPKQLPGASADASMQ